MVKVTPQLIIGASLASAATAGLAYAIYFDYKRRNDPEFRRALLKEQRKLSKASEKAASRERLAQSESLKAAVRQMRNDSPPTRTDDRESYFLEQVASGEALAAKGPQFYVAAAISFFKGLQVYPNPQELLMIYSKTQPEEVVNLLMDAVKYSMTLSGPSGPSGAAILEEIDSDTSPSVRIGRIETQTSSSSSLDDNSATSSPHSGSYVAVTPPLADR